MEGGTGTARGSGGVQGGGVWQAEPASPGAAGSGGVMEDGGRHWHCQGQWWRPGGGMWQAALASPGAVDSGGVKEDGGRHWHRQGQWWRPGGRHVAGGTSITRGCEQWRRQGGWREALAPPWAVVASRGPEGSTGTGRGTSQWCLPGGQLVALAPLGVAVSGGVQGGGNRQAALASPGMVGSGGIHGVSSRCWHRRGQWPVVVSRGAECSTGTARGTSQWCLPGEQRVALAPLGAVVASRGAACVRWH
ncbi:uncharacterized protein LOC126249107 [Schistocerca nitens]|uniref:uncharacterized protein LOC126249107 n=1 Tax=Schistocerca nitens TaxID=7011 RepID=UPI002117987E|nr:uncharacterized protein LOC126249107 [Schistocerca nitens]